MRAFTTTVTTPKPGLRRAARNIVIALAVCAAIPATANADADYSSVNAITGGSADSSQPAGSSEYSSVNSIAPPADAPTFVAGSPTSSNDGFDWASALVGAGAVLALTALGGAALLTMRRRSTVSPSPSTS